MQPFTSFTPVEAVTPPFNKNIISQMEINEYNNLGTQEEGIDVPGYPPKTKMRGFDFLHPIGQSEFSHKLPGLLTVQETPGKRKQARYSFHIESVDLTIVNNQLPLFKLRADDEVDGYCNGSDEECRIHVPCPDDHHPQKVPWMPHKPVKRGDNKMLLLLNHLYPLAQLSETGKLTAIIIAQGPVKTDGSKDSKAVGDKKQCPIPFPQHRPV